MNTPVTVNKGQLAKPVVYVIVRPIDHRCAQIVRVFDAHDKAMAYVAGFASADTCTWTIHVCHVE
jgi:hypothetical protein